MKKKGFTLIELLAVIVILALIALVLIPIMTGVIKDAKAGTAERSAANYIATVNDEVLRQKMKGNPIEDGSYLINQNGDLCPIEEGVNCSSPIVIEASGDKPTSGTVVIQKSLVITTTIIVIGDYTVSYDETKQEYVASDKNSTSDTPGSDTVTKLCRPVTSDEKTTGNVPVGNYAYGDEYICELADGVERRFFLLEDGDNTTLTKVDFTTTYYESEMAGTAGEDEVALIMDRDFTDATVAKTLAWCIDGKNDNTICQNINLKEEGTPLKHIQDIFGDSVEVSFPTKAQIVSANNESKYGLPQWMHNYLDGVTDNDIPYGYWTASPHENYSYSAYLVGYYKNVNHNDVKESGSFSVRPVITISKDQIG